MSSKVIYRLLSIGLGLASGAVAGAVFKRTWKAVAGEQDPPAATDVDRGWTEVLLAAAVEGAIFGVVQAAVSRAGATGVRQLTGEWPD